MTEAWSTVASEVCGGVGWLIGGGGRVGFSNL